MNIFSKIGRLFSSKSFYSYTHEVGQPKWSIQDDEAYVRDGFEKIVWAYSCVIALASAVGGVPWKLFKKEKEITNHYLLDMVNGQINPDMTGPEFFEIWTIYLATQGKFYALKDNPAMPSELYPMLGHQVRIVPGQGSNTVARYEYDLQQKEYSPNLILWDRFFDPLDFYDGLSPIRAAARTMETENQSTDWNKNLFDNMGMPPGAIALYNVTPNAIEEAKKRWKSDYAGPKKARIPFFFDSEKINYINFGLNQLDMDFLNQKKVSRVEICSAFGTPGQVVGDPEGQTYANFDQALKAFWSLTIIPRYLNKMAAKLNKEVARLYDPAFRLAPDLSDIAILQEDETSKTDRVRGLFLDNIITQNEARSFLNLGEVEGGDVFNYELSALLADTMIDENAEPEGGDSSDDDTGN